MVASLRHPSFARCVRDMWLPRDYAKPELRADERLELNVSDNKTDREGALRIRLDYSVVDKNGSIPREGIFRSWFVDIPGREIERLLERYRFDHGRGLAARIDQELAYLVNIVRPSPRPKAWRLYSREAA